MKRKVALVLGIAILMSVLVFNCYAAKVTVTYLDTLPSPERTALMQNIIAKFEAKNPDIKVEYTSVPWDNAYSKIMTMGASKTLPDVINSDDSSITSFTSAKYLASLQRYYNKWSQKGNLTKTTQLADNKFKGQVYVIPDGFMCNGIFVRKDWVKTLGIDLNTLSKWTWDDYFNLIEKTTDKSKNRYGIAFRGGTNGIMRFGEYLCSVLQKNAWIDRNGKSIFSNPGAVAEFKKFYGLYTNGYAPKESINWGFNEMVQGFLNGQCATLNQTPEVTVVTAKSMAEGSWAVLPIPVKKGSKKLITTWGYTAGYAISSNSQHKDEAWKFIEFASSPEINMQYCKANNMLPIFKDSLADPYFKSDALKGYTDQMLDPNVVYVTQPRYLKEYGSFCATFGTQEVQKYMTGSQSAETTVKNLADFLENAYKKYKAEGGK